MTRADIRDDVIFEIHQRRMMRKLFDYGSALNVEVHPLAGVIGVTEVAVTLSRAYGEQTDTVTVSFNDTMPDELGKRNLIKWVADEIEKQLRRLSDNGGKS